MAVTTVAQPIIPEGGATLKLKKKSLGWDYNNDTLKGVNLGGWFVLEAYITPSLFNVFGSSPPVDEYHYTQTLGKEVALSRLNQHWSSFYTEADFKDIAGFGLNVVRIPIGYWAFQLLDNDPYVQGQEAYLDQALGWATAAGLKVWIDLHGAPGSQNGFDNSGLRDVVGFQQGNNVNVTLSVLSYIANKYGGSDYEGTVIGIELLNEPLGPVLDMGNLLEFYQQGYNNVRETGTDNVVILHDAFQALHYWDSYMNIPDYWNIVVDHHNYQVFSDGELSRTLGEHILTACNLGWSTKGESHWSVCGEWSAALTDCAPWLNGVGRGARWEGAYDGASYHGSCAGTQDISTWSQETRAGYRQYIEAQLDAYEYSGAGWIFWCYKTEGVAEWDFTILAGNQIFPIPLDSRQYPNQCGFN
ncbi:glycoside hydrolase family 5 protein [Babjeviella inositovora NRRL Y-12698]|uniref:Glucan 1,3-beta-glucosidase n=1 Tax=Babjeviella inositovora NRRL Y-12698 TaxID=984486 RepID=A0A1E3QNP3_9ASCO|nr:glycoside hydrolase family 5 protein [Babjeviella inositovora NRRL Y-12698]ODQ79329.1 glycoside hydrolase family 5 protein [Babjeviella inositovora NRRL Y-12698]